MTRNIDLFLSGLEQLQITLSEEQLQQFLTFYDLLIEKNRVMNLTTITDFDEVVEKHFLDSLSLAKFVDFHSRTSVLDLGTGAGFPGIPIKIAFPEISVTLMDSLQKRVSFLDEVIEQLQLSDICAVHGRAEEMARQSTYRESYDLCISRAVANIATLSEYCIPFVKVGGQFISYKSSEIDEELSEGTNAIGLLGAHLSCVEKFQLPNSAAGRSFVFITKDTPTPKKYPRKAGTPSREPLHKM